MKAVFGLITIFALIAALNAADECDIEGHKFSVGESYMPINGNCVQHYCFGESGGFSTVGCPLHSNEGCRLGEWDKTKPYPDCCPKEICD